MKSLLETKTTSLRELLGNGKVYKIPLFQRDYSWREENWEDLWNDCLHLEKSDNPHYMGAIVLQTTQDDDRYIVVDGQQRITTITIIIVAIIKVLTDLIEGGVEKDDNEERKESIVREFIGTKTISALHYQSKLTLNNNNNLFFQRNILQLKEPVSIGKLGNSDKLLYEAYQYFYGQLKEKFKNDDGERISRFLEKVIAKKIIFIQIIVYDDLSAYTIFETLNARGMDLTVTDLLKNFLFSKVSEESSEINLLEETWKRIIDSVGLKRFPRFLRYYLNAQQNFVRKDQLFKIIKRDISSIEDVFSLLDKLEKKANLYNALQNPDDDFWNDFPQKHAIKKSLNELKLFHVSQHIPLLFSVYDNLRGSLDKVLKICSVIAFRYNVIGKKNPNDMESAYSTLAERIHNREINNIRDIIKNLQVIYINDGDFRNLFSTKVISTRRSKKIVKYILTKIENQLSETDNDPNDANFTIEHILPENFNESWNDLFDEKGEEYIYRLGNYTLLENKKNKECGNKDFAKKREIYQESRYKLTKEHLNLEEWNIPALEKYQKKLAEYATSVWRINN